MTEYKGKRLSVRRDHVVVYDGEEIGTVYPDAADRRVNHDWVYEHATGTTLKDLHPGWGWPRTVQGSTTKQDAARDLAELHLAIAARASGETPLRQLDEHLTPEGAHWTPEGPHGELWAVRWYSDMGIVEAVGYPHGSGEFHGRAADLPAARREVLRIAGLIGDGKTREA